LKRLLALLTGLAALPLVGPAPHAEALGVAGCTIGGTISFTPPGKAAAQGTWRIDRGAINCQGSYKSTDRFLGQGSFTGSGVYEVLPMAGETCLYQAGTGMVDYEIRTTAGTYRIKEASKFVTVGAGKLATPSLRGSFLVPPPSESDCVTQVTRANFVAQVLLVRDPQIGVDAGVAAGGQR
jgi:hypothetical protein